MDVIRYRSIPILSSLEIAGKTGREKQKQSESEGKKKNERSPALRPSPLPLTKNPVTQTFFDITLPRFGLNFHGDIMKKIHIILLVFIAGAIAVLISYLQTSATYESIAGAKANPGKFVHVAAKLDKSHPLDYDATKDPNYLSFIVVDSTGDQMKVVYRNGNIENLQISERLVLEGKFNSDHFECKRVQTKCPSKYKDDMNAAEKNIQKTTQAETGNTDTKY